MRTDPQFRHELEDAVDFDTVLAQIAAFASFSCSADAIRNALPSTDLPAIQESLALAGEAMKYEQNGGTLSIGGIRDIFQEIALARKRVTLSPEGLLAVASFLAAARNVHHAFEAETYPLLADIAGTIDPCTRLFEAISKCIDLSGSVKEDATSTLRSLHARLLRLKADLSKKGKAFVRRNESSLMDSITTTIGGRLCVLVKASEKNRFGGMVHGSSQSGQAYYIEAGEFVELNNDIQSCQLDIEEEKKKICQELSRMVRQNADALESALESMQIIDTALAKGKWALKHDGCIPMLSKTRDDLLLEHAIHPLLEQQSAVPNTYQLKGGQKILMISGPNMGGKTVTLKTIGLFAALAQAGFPVAAHRALLPFYEEMFFDIGDNQSIENNLSTFSSHVSRLRQITDQAGRHTFVLLDEAGNGTDPLEGASLAQAVLEYLLEAGSTVITSTHYDELKAYGKSEPRVLVSSVEFDPETLRPTYRYLPGISGSSYAFDIASQLCLNGSILDRARSLKKANESEVQKQLESLEHLQQEALHKKDRFDALIQDAHRIQKEAETEKAKWEKQKKQLDDTYSAQLEEMLDEKRREAKEILAEMRKAQGPIHEQIAKAHELESLSAPAADKPVRQVREGEFKPGDYVHVEMLNNHGEVVEVKKKKAVVLVNGRKMSVSLDQLTHMNRPKVQKIKTSRTDRTFEAFPMEVNLIGMHVEEGLQALDHYLDQAIVHRMKNVRIIHGVGTGALRSAVWKDLAARKNTIARYETAGPGEGGLGATLVEFK